MRNTLLKTIISYRVFLILILGLPSYLSSWEITLKDAEIIGQQIFVNECGGKNERLVWWNEGENFASLGIGHFIWYPQGNEKVFEETFPMLLKFMSEQDVPIPIWLKKHTTCPWHTKKEFSEDSQSARKKELQLFLSRTISWQTAFIAKRFQDSTAHLFSGIEEGKKQQLLRKVALLAQSLKGKYALIDYLHFKGAGKVERERYCGQGWGLRQVIEEMPEHPNDLLLAFSETAKNVLKRRVKNSPIERNEERWLPGWLARVDSYLHFQDKKTNTR